VGSFVAVGDGVTVGVLVAVGSIVAVGAGSGVAVAVFVGKGVPVGVAVGKGVGARAKTAVTVPELRSVTTQGSLPLHSPCHPTKRAPSAAAAVSVTGWPGANSSEQRPTQVEGAGFPTTTPAPSTASVSRPTG
jgi:UDP-3-O-[3-hydroxymyristoyl] glucosamine N-acyltransferase